MSFYAGVRANASMGRYHIPRQRNTLNQNWNDVRRIGEAIRQRPNGGRANAYITGVSRDSAGAVLGNCVVDLFLTANDQFLMTRTSDASGNFSFPNPGTGPFYIVAYKVGSPDKAGTTVNTLVSVQA